MSLTRAFQAWVSLSGSEKCRFLSACYWLCVCAGRIRLSGLPGLADYIERRRMADAAPPPADLDERVAAWHRAVARAARVLPVGTCLERAATLQLLLGRERIATALKIGVHKRQQTLRAHAWLERGGRPVMEHVDPALRAAVFHGPWSRRRHDAGAT